jgi:hypothetical protein
MARFANEIEPPYCEAFKGILSFSSFAAAEKTIKRLENLRRKYLGACDKRGVEYCRRIAFLGRRRSELICRNDRVCLQKRLQKQEIATWFKIWLETPDIFDMWLAMRKNTEEFKELLQSENLGRSKSGERNASGAKIP